MSFMGACIADFIFLDACCRVVLDDIERSDRVIAERLQIQLDGIRAAELAATKVAPGSEVDKLRRMIIATGHEPVA